MSVLRLVFQFGHADEVVKKDLTDRLKSLEVRKEPADPYTMGEAEAIIQGIRNYRDADHVELGFFASTRHSELIALQWSMWT